MASLVNCSSSSSLTRRSLLQLGAGSLVALTGARTFAMPLASREYRCIFLNLVGGPSQLDTWDPKPQAPSEYRGPFRAISTNVPGIQISELFPRMATMAHRYALVRSVYHDAAPIHETGQQLIQTGKLIPAESCVPHPLSASSKNLVLPGKMENTGVQLSHGQDGLSDAGESFRHEVGSSKLQESYGQHEFGRACLQARAAIEQGHRLVTVNMFRTVYDTLSWDCHADGYSLNVNLQDYRNHVAPMFDNAYTALLTDLESRGLLETTLVIAAGEFGRSPKINLRGGRDHWADAWTVLLAGGGIQGGQVVGSTDRLGMKPTSRPVHASAIANTMLNRLGIQPVIDHQDGAPLNDLFSRKTLA